MFPSSGGKGWGAIHNHNVKCNLGDIEFPNSFLILSKIWELEVDPIEEMF
jgi:hypothetical protein